MRTHRAFFLILGLVLLAAPPAAAQAWDAPSFLPPRPGDDLGVYVVQPDGADWGLAAIWRQGGSLNLGARVGIVQPEVGDLAFQAGGELWGSLLEAGATFPVDVTWTAAFGATFGEGTHARIPVGVSVGRALSFGGLGFTPYLHPRFALDVFAQDDFSDTDTSLLTDVGIDLSLGERLTVRVAASFGDGGDVLGAGVAYRVARGVEVR